MNPTSTHPALLHSNQPIIDFKLFGGGKAKNMAILSQNGVPVPEWFCLGTEWFEQYLLFYSLEAQLVPTGDLAAFEKSVEKLFLSYPLPDQLMKKIDDTIKELKLDQNFVAVRSSGLDEDSENHSFAGLFSSYLFQKGSENISAAIRKCWASAFSERALSYRLQRKIVGSRPKLGVIIQKMVNSESSGVMFTRDPIHPLNRDHRLSIPCGDSVKV